MAKYRFFYSVFLIVSTVLMFSYKSKLTSVLFLISVILPIVSFILLLMTKLLLKVRIEYRTLTAEKFENTDISVTVTNRFIVPVSPGMLTGCFPYRNSEKFEQQKVMVSVPPFSSVTINFNSPVKYRGVYRSGIESFVIYDLFKLFRIAAKYEHYESFIVLPRKLVIEPITDTGDGDSETLSQNSFSLDKNAFASIREYRNEDPIKNVHWAMSAKHDKLMVKQMERSIGGTEEDNMLLFDIMSMLPRQHETFLPETIASSCTETTGDTSSVYFVTSQLRRDFIGKMTEIELFRNKQVKILLVSSPIESDEQRELAGAISVTSGFELWKIDKDDIVQSLNAAIELHKKK